MGKIGTDVRTCGFSWTFSSTCAARHPICFITSLECIETPKYCHNCCTYTFYNCCANLRYWLDMSLSVRVNELTHSW